MANRLLRYDLALFRASFAEGFARKRDRLLLLLVALFALLWLRDALGRLALPSLPLWLGALAAVPAFAWHRRLGARLGWLTEHGAVAAAALDARSRRSYLLSAHALPAVPLLVAAVPLAPVAGPALALPAYAVGVGLAALVPIGAGARGTGMAPGRRPSAGGNVLLRAVLRRQTLDSARPELAALSIVVATFALTVAALWLSRAQSDAIRITAPMLPAFLALLVTSRLDAALIGFLPYAGRSARVVGLAVSALPAACLLAAAAAILVMRPPGMIATLAIIALLHLVFILAGLARAWLYPGRHGRAVDLQVQIELAGLALIATMLAPVAPVALGWRLWWLGRRHKRFLRIQL
jgi:hypothetical protein